MLWLQHRWLEAPSDITGPNRHCLWQVTNRQQVGMSVGYLIQFSFSHVVKKTCCILRLEELRKKKKKKTLKYADFKDNLNVYLIFFFCSLGLVAELFVLIQSSCSNSLITNNTYTKQ